MLVINRGSKNSFSSATLLIVCFSWTSFWTYRSVSEKAELQADRLKEYPLTERLQMRRDCWRKLIPQTEWSRLVWEVDWLTVLWVEFYWSPKQQTCSGPRGLDPILEVLKLLPFHHWKLILWNQYLFHGRPKSTCQEQINNVIFQKGNLFSCHLCLWYRNLSDCLFQFCHPGIYLKP